MRRAVRPDAGAALVETLVAIVLVGIALVTIVGSQGAAMLVSAADRNRADAELVLTNVAEAVRNPAVVPFVSCGDDPATVRDAPDVPVRSGWSVATTYAWWDGTGFVDMCPDDPALPAVQLVTIVVTDSAGAETSREIVKVA